MDIERAIVQASLDIDRSFCHALLDCEASGATVAQLRRLEADLHRLQARGGALLNVRRAVGTMSRRVDAIATAVIEIRRGNDEAVERLRLQLETLLPCGYGLIPGRI